MTCKIVLASTNQLIAAGVTSYYLMHHEFGCSQARFPGFDDLILCEDCRPDLKTPRKEDWPMQVIFTANASVL